MEDTYYALQNRYCTNDGHAQSHSTDGTDRTATVTIKVVPGANSHGIQTLKQGPISRSRKRSDLIVG